MRLVCILLYVVGTLFWYLCFSCFLPLLLASCFRFPLFLLMIARLPLIVLISTHPSIPAMRERVREARGESFGRWSLRESLGLKPLVEDDIDRTNYEEAWGQDQEQGGWRKVELTSTEDDNSTYPDDVDLAGGYTGEESV